MILRTPFEICPCCAYSLAESPAGQRCPECGLDCDQNTVVFKSSSTLRYPIFLIGVGLGLAFLLGPAAVDFLIAVLGPQVGGLVATVIALTVIFLPAGIAYLNTRHGRFVAVGPSGITIKTGHEISVIPWSDLSRIAMRDSTPWIKRQGQDREIFLRGVFENDQEKSEFESLISFFRSKMGEE